MQEGDYIAYLHHQIFALETNYGAAIAINQQLHHVCEKAKSDILEREGQIKERDEEIVQILSSLFNQMKLKEQLREKENTLQKGCTQLQESLQESKIQCGALEEELSKQLAEKEERHRLELSETAEKFRRELADQAEKFRQDLSTREENLLKQVSEKEESLQEVISERNQLSELCASLEKKAHQLEVEQKNVEVNKTEFQQIKEENLQEVNTECKREENMQQQETKKKKGFWRRLFQRKKKTADPSRPSRN